MIITTRTIVTFVYPHELSAARKFESTHDMKDWEKDECTASCSYTHTETIYWAVTVQEEIEKGGANDE